MLKKILKIDNIGRFKNYSPIGNVELKKVSIIFAENGRGKTTLSAIFRSLKEQEPAYITERSTLGTSETSKVELLTDEGTCKFIGSWDRTCQGIEIFDTTFVNRNVFSGENVEHDHKKNLYRFVVGEKGVSLALKVDDLDNKIRDKNNEISAKSLQLQRFIVGNEITVSEFIALRKNDNIQELLKVKEKEIELIKKSNLITTKPTLQKIVVPSYPREKIEEILLKQLSEISKSAEQKTREHVNSHLDINGESWLQRGLNYTISDLCPFCGQDIDKNELIEAYKGYFDLSYKQHKDEIVNAKQSFSGTFSEVAAAYIRRIYDSNSNLLEFWKEYVNNLNESVIEIVGLENTFRGLRESTNKYLDDKNRSPLDKIIIGEDLNKLIEDYIEIEKEITEYNKNVETNNEKIQKKKLQAGGGDLTSSLSEFDKLKNISARFAEKTISICDNYQKLLDEKRALEDEKKTAKNKLNEFTEEVFEKYQNSINKYLDIFGAGFKIDNTKIGYIGGGASSSYCIKINDVSVGLGDTRTYGKPCFRTILSQGDKNTLAFAFFLARLEHDEDIGSKIIIFDDPVSSLDDHRKLSTEQEILKIAKSCKQCVVMSHDKYFLRTIWNNTFYLELNNLQIIRDRDGSKIVEWDILPDTRGTYFNDFYKIINYIKVGASTDDERKSVARCIRPTLEGYLRMKFPDDFGEKENLGNFIDKIKELSNTDLEKFKTKYLQELENINDYSKKYHHKINSNASDENISDGELLSYCKRTLKLITE